ncbi:lipase 3-like [Trichogramma pretiosum]|uniref:lipase 3-like n=1 Tax=Trichogramma pretiosum TaxID=7493 RepID=UPI000C71BE21|nr:lipase 3-like [Trichogramma pretiosum]
MKEFSPISFVIFSCLLQVNTYRIRGANEKSFVKLKSKSELAKADTEFDPLENIDPEVDCYYLIKNRNYTVEKHVITTDGYRIAIYRIPSSPKKPSVKRLPVVMQHGLLMSCFEWIFAGPRHDLAFMLADLGHDVWITNIRGTVFGRSHLTLSPDHDPEFWEFSYHEMATVDMANIIDYVLDVTNQKQIMYVGHSMGTSISYILLSTKPEYNEKIKLVVSFTPVAYWYDPQASFIGNMKPLLKPCMRFLESTRMHEILPVSTALSNMLNILCDNRDTIYKELCQYLIFFSFGYNPDQVPETPNVVKFFRYFPAGASRQTLKHFTQNILEGEFRPIDFGPEKNMIKYGTPDARPYNLKKISAPVALFYGYGDTLIAPHNVVYLSKVLPNVEVIEAVPHERFNHFDFVIARDVKKLLYDRVMEVMARYY